MCCPIQNFGVVFGVRRGLFCIFFTCYSTKILREQRLQNYKLLIYVAKII